MEQQQNWPELLELLERPAFTVEQGRVSWANQEALTRLVPQGQEIHSLLQTGAEEYAELGNGSLCLSLQIGDSRQEAAVRRLNGGVDLFLLNQEADLAGLNQLALAARQLREPLGNAMLAADRLFPELELTEAPGLQDQMSTINQGLFQLLRIINNMADASQYLTARQPNRELKNEKTPSERIQKEIFSGESGQLVELQGHAALFPGSVVLVKNSFLHALVNGLDGGLVGAVGLLAVAGGHSGFELLDSGLQGGLVGLVLLISGFGQRDSLLCGLNVGHRLHLLQRVSVEPARGQSHAEIHYSGFGD